MELFLLLALVKSLEFVITLLFRLCKETLFADLLLFFNALFDALDLVLFVLG